MRRLGNAANNRRRKSHSHLFWWVVGGVVVLSSVAVLRYAKQHPGPAATALLAAWLIPGIPPPGPFG